MKQFNLTRPLIRISGLFAVILAATAMIVLDRQVEKEAIQHKTADQIFSDNPVIASWVPPKVGPVTAGELLAKLDSLRYPDANPGIAGRIQAQLTQTQQAVDTTEMLFVRARLAQYQHRFEEAELILLRLLERDPRHHNGHLLLATVQMQQGNYKEAELSCQKTLGRLSHLLTATCISEARLSPDADVMRIYRPLRHMVLEFPESQTEINDYALEVLADMALMLGEAEQASAYLAGIPADRQSISQIVLWSRSQIALQRYSKVLSRLSTLIENNTSTNDTLLLYVAMAERFDGNATHWQKQMAERVKLRSQRGDVAHASEIARYYLDLEDNQKLALHWADLNWQHARGLQDSLLLTRAQRSAAAHGFANAVREH